MARRGQRQPRARRTVTRKPRRVHDRDGGGIIAVLARAVREVEAAVQQGTAKPSVRTKFQVVALLMRQERARVKADEAGSVARRAEQRKRLDGIGTNLAKSAARDPSLLALLEEDAAVSDAGRALERNMLRAAGVETDADEVTRPVPETSTTTERRVVPQSVISRQLANPFLTPDFSAAEQPAEAPPRRLASWELLGPLFRSFEVAAGGVTSCMDLPDPSARRLPGGLELMRHQAEVVAAAASGHRDPWRR